MTDERSGISSAVEPPLDAVRGPVETVLAFASSRAAMRLDFARSLAQCKMLTPEKSEIRQHEKMMAAMFPLRFHSAISALVVLVAEAVVVVVEELLALVGELLDVVEVAVVVDLAEVDEVVLILVVIVEVDDMPVEVEVEVEVDVVDAADVSEELVLVDGSELVLADVVEAVDSEGVDVSRAIMITRLISSRALNTFIFPSVLDDRTLCISDSSEDVEGLYGWHMINAKCDASRRIAVPRSLVMLIIGYHERGKQQGSCIHRKQEQEP